MHSLPRVPAMAALIGVAACGAGERGPAVAIRDSAGITIVESHRAAWSDHEALRLDSLPMVRIGTVEGEPQYQFHRVMGVARLSTGEVVVADGGSLELRWYDTDGRFMRRQGGAGDGPGEYRFIMAAIHIPGDTILAVEGVTSEARAYDATGTLTRTWRIQELAPLIRPLPIGRFPDGHLLAMQERTPPRDVMTGHVRQVAMLVRYRDGEVADTLAEFPGSERWFAACGPNNQGLCPLLIPFGPSAAATIQGTRAVTGNGDGYTMQVWEAGQGLVAIYRRPVPSAPPSAERVAGFQDSMVARIPPARREAALELQRTVPAPTTMAAFTRLVSDDTGRLWVARHAGTDLVAAPWDVFDSEGRWLGTVEFPRSLRVYHIGADFVAGVVTDDDDVEFVEVHRLTSG